MIMSQKCLSTSSDFVCKIVSLHSQLRPKVHDTAPMVAWLATMQEGIINLGLSSGSLDSVHGHLVRYCQAGLTIRNRIE